MTDTHYDDVLAYPKRKMELKIKGMYDRVESANNRDKFKIEQYQAKLRKLKEGQGAKRLYLEEKIDELEDIIIKRGEKNRLLVDIERDRYQLLVRWTEVQKQYKIYE